MPHLEKIKLIEWLYRLIEKHQNHEDGMDGNDYIIGVDSVIAGLGLGKATIEMGIATLAFIASSFFKLSTSWFDDPV